MAACGGARGPFSQRHQLTLQRLDRRVVPGRGLLERRVCHVVVGHLGKVKLGLVQLFLERATLGDLDSDATSSSPVASRSSKGPFPETVAAPACSLSLWNVSKMVLSKPPVAPIGKAGPTLTLMWPELFGLTTIVASLATPCFRRSRSKRCLVPVALLPVALSSGAALRMGLRMACGASSKQTRAATRTGSSKLPFPFAIVITIARRWTAREKFKKSGRRTVCSAASPVSSVVPLASC